MAILNWIRFILAAVLITAGLVFYAIQFIGVYRFQYILTRMHAAAIGDTLGMGLVLLGTTLIYGFSMASLKVVIILAFMWFTSPVCSHLLAKLEVLSQRHRDDRCPVVKAEDIGKMHENAEQEKEAEA